MTKFNDANNSGKDNKHAINRRNLVLAGAGVAIGAAASQLSPQDAQAQTLNGSAKTLIIASHPYPQRSVVNKALWQVAQTAENSLYRNLEALYGDNMRGFDRTAERELYRDMERLVFMYPTHWFNMPPMLKAYLNEVWGAGAPPELRGKELLIVTTAGANQYDYQPNGSLGFTMEQVLAPFHASAHYTGMIFSKPLAFLGVSGSKNALQGYCDALAARLREPPSKA